MKQRTGQPLILDHPQLALNLTTRHLQMKLLQKTPRTTTMMMTIPGQSRIAQNIGFLDRLI